MYCADFGMHHPIRCLVFSLAQVSREHVQDMLCIPRSLYIESWAGVDDEMLFYEMDKPQNESPSPHLLSTEYIHAREVSSF